MNNNLTPKQVRRTDGVITTVHVKPDAAKKVRPLPVAAPAAAQTRVFVTGEKMSSLSDFESARDRTMIRVDKTGDIMTKKGEQWFYVGLAHLGGLPNSLMATRPSTVMG